jgi:hypothetical protein
MTDRDDQLPVLVLGDGWVVEPVDAVVAGTEIFGASTVTLSFADQAHPPSAKA